MTGRVAAVALLAIALLIMGVVVAGLAGLALVLVSMLVASIMAAGPLCDLFGCNPLQAVGHLFRLLLGMEGAIQIIDDGKTVAPKAKGPLLGPRTVIMRPGNAGILVNGGKITRVEGPRMFHLAQYEYVKRVCDLHEKQERLSVEDVLSEDKMATNITLEVCYRLRVEPAAQRGERRLLPVETKALLAADASLPEWSRAASSTIEGAVRRAAGQRNIDELLAADESLPLARDIVKYATDELLKWGVQVDRITVTSIQPKVNLSDITTTRWKAAAAKEVESNRAQSVKDALVIIADGYKAASDKGMTPAQIRDELICKTLEELAQDPATKLVLTPDFATFLGLDLGAAFTPGPAVAATAPGADGRPPAA